MPATYSQIDEFLAQDRWTPSEKWVIRWQFGLLAGEFESGLAHLIKCADQGNLGRLSMGFPTEVTGYTAWVWGDLGERLRRAGLMI